MLPRKQLIHSGVVTRSERQRTACSLAVHGDASIVSSFEPVIWSHSLPASCSETRLRVFVFSIKLEDLKLLGIRNPYGGFIDGDADGPH